MRPRGVVIKICQPLFSMIMGRRDTATWWFWQSQIGGYHVFDHDSGWGIDAEEWAHRLKEKLMAYQSPSRRDPLGKIWLPHDARAKTFAAKRSAVEIFIDVFGADKVAITPNSRISDRINAARVLMPRIAFHETRCAKGLEALRSWSYAYDEEKKIFSSEPNHDWASHDGDGFSYGCLIMKQAEPPKPAVNQQIRGLTAGNIHGVTMDELWAMAPTNRRERY